MPEEVSHKTVFSLVEVLNSIQKALAERYKSCYWIKAEICKLNYYRHSGHCYPELIEKQGTKVMAQTKAMLWKDDYNRINRHFVHVLREPLKDGIKILFLAKISFDPLYGLALKIIDIDPSFTLGDLEKEKQATIGRMKSEGIFDKNKTTCMPMLPQRIAIISVETSKGYADFLEVLQTNSWGYAFFHMLFPASLQGDQAIISIIGQLQRIKKVRAHFDVVAIVRGGGGDVGLSCYNDYALASEIALFPLPVITGIGHATNETVVEMISFSNGITPTKIAGYLLQKFHNFSVPVQKAQEKILERSGRQLGAEAATFNSAVKLFRSVTVNILAENRSRVKVQAGYVLRQALFNGKHEVDQLRHIAAGIKKRAFIILRSQWQKTEELFLPVQKAAVSGFANNTLMLFQHVRRFLYGAKCIVLLKKELLFQYRQKLTGSSYRCLKDNTAGLLLLQKQLNYLSPQNVLKRGYSISRVNGKVIKNLHDVQAGDNIETVVPGGKIKSIVQSS